MPRPRAALGRLDVGAGLGAEAGTVLLGGEAPGRPAGRRGRRRSDCPGVLVWALISAAAGG